MDGREESARVVVFITDPECTALPQLEYLKQALGLSRAEAAVAIHLLQDRTPQEVAHLQGVSIATVRFHMKQWLAKTGARRQGELMRILSQTSHVRAVI